MYEIKANGQTLKYAERFDYVRRLRSGSPQVVRDKAEATGIFATPEVYSLEGFGEFDGPEVTVEQIDGAGLVNELTADLELAYELLYGGEA